MVSKDGLRRVMSIEALFGSKDRVLIGRSPECDVCLPHPTISRRHAVLERRPDGLRLRDLNSVNGVLIGGQRIHEPVMIQERERIGIGPFLFSLSGNIFYTLDSSQSLRLEARSLEKVVSLGGGKQRKLLDQISFAVEPGEFISLLGPSGSGKSTLMDCLNGRRPATGGRVLANGEDFYQHFNSFRQSLGYVPQRDIVHSQLTVYRALYYTARLRLPTDTEDAELESRIEDVLRQMELGPHRQTLITNLSGGQIKRVSLGAELLARPCLLYIDEATSGLDAGTEARMMRLFRHLSDEGKSVICITHNVDNVDSCNQALILLRGKLVYFGPPKEALGYFQVSRLGEVYDRLGTKEAEAWEKDYAQSSLYQEFVQKRISSEPETGEGKEDTGKRLRETPLGTLRALLPELPSLRTAGDKEGARERPYRPPLWHQFRILTARYAELMWGDRRSLRLLYLQAPIVAVVILLGFLGKKYDQTMPEMRPLDQEEKQALEALEDLLQRQRLGRDLTAEERQTLEQFKFPVKGGQQTITGLQLREGIQKFDRSDVIPRILKIDGPVLPGEDRINPRYTYMLLFLMAVTVLWFGCNNAAKEIVKEEAIYGRERAVNLGILPYLGSKFLILSVISASQALILMAMVYGTMYLGHLTLGYSMPYPLYRLDYPQQLGVLVLLSMTGVALGLLLSGCVSTPDRANSLLPYVLIPQIILGGAMMQFDKGPLYWLAFTASPVYWAYRAIHLGAPQLPTYVPGYVDYYESVPLSCLALVVQAAVLLLATAWFLRRKDVGRA
jgi:ABC-type multidrug transport system ATPase subunit